MNKKAKTGIVVLLLLLAIGFAAVTTNLIINGTAKLAAANINGLVYFSAATPETGGTAEIEPVGKQTINYTTKQLMVVGDTATLDYTVLNDSAQYDVDVTMSIQIPTNSPGVTWSDYVTIEYEGFQPAEQGNDHAVNIPGKQTHDGKITITLNKVSTEDIEIEFIITLDVKAVERTSTATSPSGGGGGDGSCSHTNDGELAYFDPVSSNECSKNTFSAANVKAGTSTCYAWRVIKNCDDTYELQLDHQLATSPWITRSDYDAAATAGGKTNKWVSADDYYANVWDDYHHPGTKGNGSGELGPITALKTLEYETRTWTRVDPITYSYTNVVDIATPGRGYTNEVAENYGTLTCTNGVCSVSNNSTYSFTSTLRARLITYEDVRGLYGTNNPTTLAPLVFNGDNILVISRESSNTPQYNVGKTLWWLFENGLDRRLSTSSTTGATPTVYWNQAMENKYDQAVTYGAPYSGEDFDVTLYWTLSPGIKTSGTVGEGQVGWNTYALAITGKDDIYGDEGVVDSWNGGTAKFMAPGGVAGLRPIVKVPAAQVRLHNEN